MTKSFTVTLTEPTKGDWHMLYNSIDYGPGHYPPLPVPYKDDGYFTFVIGKNASSFASSPIAVAAGNGKPSVNHIDSQIEIKKQTSSRLEFSDTNHDKGPLNYVLYFNDGTTLDPIIDNGGGHTVYRPSTAQAITLSYANLAIVLVLVFIIGGAIGWVLGRR